MANRIFDQKVKTSERELIWLGGVITIPSGGTPTGDTIDYASASLKSTGQYRITLEDNYVSLQACNLTLLSTSSQGLVLRMSGTFCSGVYSGSVQTTPPCVDFSMGVLTGSGTGADVFAVAGNTAPCEVHVSMFLKNSTR